MATIEYFYSAHSAYAYLGHRKLLDICEKYQCQLVHRPILLSPVMEAAGGVPFAERSQEHADYFFGLEIERWSDLRGVTIMKDRPTFHDSSYDLANRLLIAAGEGGLQIDQLAWAFFQAHWVKDADLSDEAQLATIVESTDLEWSSLYTQAESAQTKELHRRNEEEAIRRSVFGSPTYFLDGEMFYGQDRLEMMEHALKSRG